MVGAYRKDIKYEGNLDMPYTPWAARAFESRALDSALGQSMSFPSLPKILLRVEVPLTDLGKARDPPPNTNVSESEAESSITGTREPSPIYAQPVPVGGEDDLVQPEDVPSEEEGPDAYPTYLVPQRHGRFAFRWSRLSTAADNFANEVAQGITQIGAAAWQSCHQLQIVKLPPSVVCLQEGVLQGCYALGQITAPGCVQFGPRVFAECCSLSMVGPGKGANNALAPGAQIAPFAFESCLALTTIEFVMSSDDRSRAPTAVSVERALRAFAFHLILRGSTFSYCVALVDVWLPPRIRRIGKEAFLCCTSLQEVVVPPKLQHLGTRAFCGCEQLTLFTKLDDPDTWRGVCAEDNTFLMCGNFERDPSIKLLPPRDTDSDAFDEELHKGLH